MANISILKASTVVQPDSTYYVPLAKVADKGAWKANLPLPADTEPLMGSDTALGWFQQYLGESGSRPSDQHGDGVGYQRLCGRTERRVAGADFRSRAEPPVRRSG